MGREGIEQAKEISRIAAAPDFPFDPDLLRHVSPIEWDNVILYDQYAGKPGAVQVTIVRLQNDNTPP